MKKKSKLTKDLKIVLEDKWFKFKYLGGSLFLGLSVIVGFFQIFFPNDTSLKASIFSQIMAIGLLAACAYYLYQRNNYLTVLKTKVDLYMANIDGFETVEIDKLTSIVGDNDIRIREMLLSLKDHGLLQDYVIQQETRLIVHHHANKAAKKIINGSNQQKSVKCPNCGAENTITVGSVNTCPYCDTPLD